jgi:hypothetical protein
LYRKVTRKVVIEPKESEKIKKPEWQGMDKKCPCNRDTGLFRGEK